MIHLRLAWVVAMLGVVAPAVSDAVAQTSPPVSPSVPAASSSPAAAAGGTIRGQVVALETGRALARARVTIVSAATAGRPVASASTDPMGRYELRGVPPGQYYVNAARAGYVQLQHGQRRPRERGVLVEIKDGVTRDRIDMSLPRGSVISGRVLDELGQPYPGVQVNVLEMRYREGRRVPFPAGVEMTDDRGVYRTPGLLPGTYQVSAMSSETWLNEKRENVGYALTYFPGGSPESASDVVLGLGQQRLDVDLTLTAARSAVVRGRLIRESGGALVGATVRLARTFRGLGAVSTAGALSTTTGPDGGFVFRDVTLGDYMVLGGGGGENASTFAAVYGDLDEITLVTRTGSTIAGRVVTDEGETPPFPASGVRVNLVAPYGDRVLPTVRVPAVNTDWTVTLERLGGPFFFRMIGLPAGWMLDAVRWGERDIVDEPLDVPTGGKRLPDIELVITRKAGRVTGRVLAADDKPTADAAVVLFAEDEQHWLFGSRYVHTIRPTADGDFTFVNLPAGSYYLVARQTLLDGEHESPEFLERARTGAVRVTLQAGGTVKVDVKRGE